VVESSLSVLYFFYVLFGFFFFFFFFQAEDGIRDFHVTGVQTCALPISSRSSRPSRPATPTGPPSTCGCTSSTPAGSWWPRRPARSEERRVGKECRSRWAPER